MRLYLNIEYDDGSTCPDVDGGEYASVDAATEDARKGLKDLIRETIDIEEARVATHIHIVDEAGHHQRDVTIGEVVPPCVRRALA